MDTVLTIDGARKKGDYFYTGNNIGTYLTPEFLMCLFQKPMKIFLHVTQSLGPFLQ